MNKYILMLGVAAVSIGSYCSYAGNSATMTVTATIAHDVSLTKTRDLSFGTITINPGYTGEDTNWNYDSNGSVSIPTGMAIVSADNATVGIFTANVPAPFTSLSVTGNSGSDIGGIFGGTIDDNYCGFSIEHGSGNVFYVYPEVCDMTDVSIVRPGVYEGTLTIEYSPS
ncbi:MAG: hypothetical protein IJ689_06650 [Alphaproteobacteria bacterium]|nr:hypothetical protein [Alphaproteobacteria bacterium]